MHIIYCNTSMQANSSLQTPKKANESRNETEFRKENSK